MKNVSFDESMFVLVPREPTLEMGWAYLEAARKASPHIDHAFNHPGYRAMLAAAPTPTEGEAVRSLLQDPVAVHVALLRGEIAKPAIRDMLHVYGADALAQFDRGATPVAQAAAGASEPPAWQLQFLTDVLTAAGLLAHGKCDKGLAQRLGEGSMRWRTALSPRTEADADRASGGGDQAARDVLAERARQVSAEGWTPEHDDEHFHGDMARAASSYALKAASHASEHPGIATWLATAADKAWPWDSKWWKPGDPRRMLVKAGALLLAEIERLDRREARGPICSDCGAREGDAHNYGCMYSDLDV